MDLGFFDMAAKLKSQSHVVNSEYNILRTNEDIEWRHGIQGKNEEISVNPETPTAEWKGFAKERPYHNKFYYNEFSIKNVVQKANEFRGQKNTIQEPKPWSKSATKKSTQKIDNSGGSLEERNLKNQRSPMHKFDFKKGAVQAMPSFHEFIHNLMKKGSK